MISQSLSEALTLTQMGFYYEQAITAFKSDRHKRYGHAQGDGRGRIYRYPFRDIA